MGTPTWRPPDGNSLMEASIWKLRWVPLASQMRMKLEIDWWTPPQSTGPGNDHFEVETCLHGTFHMEASIRELPYGGPHVGTPIWRPPYGNSHMCRLAQGRRNGRNHVALPARETTITLAGNSQARSPLAGIAPSGLFVSGTRKSGILQLGYLAISRRQGWATMALDKCRRNGRNPLGNYMAGNSWDHSFSYATKPEGSPPKLAPDHC